MQAPPCYDCAISQNQELETKLIQKKQEVKELEEQIQRLKLIEEKKDIIVKVGPLESCTNIFQAITKLIQDYGVDGSGYKCTILLDSSFIWKWNVTIEQDLFWITLKSNVQILVTDEFSVKPFLKLIKNGKINFEVSLLFIYNSKIETNNAHPNAALYIKNCVWTTRDNYAGAQFHHSGRYHIFFENVKFHSGPALSNWHGIAQMINCYFTGGSLQISHVDNLVIKNTTFEMCGDYDKPCCTGLNIGYGKNVLFENMTVIGKNNIKHVFQLYEGIFTLKNCTIHSTVSDPTSIGLYGFSHSKDCNLTILLDGGNYYASNNSNAIVAYGQTTFIRKSKKTIGGHSSQLNGTVIIDE